ncbi:MAG: hypothetical protein ACRCZP_17665 [Phycicoccus sp.]
MTGPIGGRWNLPEVGQALLGHIVSYWTVHGGNPPERRYLVAGEPRLAVWDCEQVTVAVSGVEPGPAPGAEPDTMRAGRPANTFGTCHVTWVVQVVRCVAVMDEAGQPPSPAVLQSDGARHLADVGLMHRALAAFLTSGSPLLDGVTVTAPSVGPVGPAGMYAAVEGTFTAQAVTLVGG